MVAQETSNVDKEVFAINGLEAKVQNTKNPSNDYDREMLANMKKGLGLEVWLKKIKKSQQKNDDFINFM